MRHRHTIAAILLATAIVPVLPAQSRPGYGWSSWGTLPFRGVDFLIVKAPSRYILYFTKQFAPGEPLGDIHGRAFSPDMKTWTRDTGDICGTSGDLCRMDGATTSGILTLPDGRLRMYFMSQGAGLGGKTGVLTSAISSDGVVWTREAGTRFTPDSSSLYEQGPFTAVFVSFIPLDDGSVRMYYSGQVVPGTAGAPAWYNATPASTFPGCVTLSAISKDNGLTWTREPGIRINPIVQGPVNRVQALFPATGTRNYFLNTDFTAVSLKEDGRMVYRLYSQTMRDGVVSYVSQDGLNFWLEGQIPAAAGDPKATVLPDGRVWLISNQYPDSIVDMLVYGPQSLILHSVKAQLPAGPIGFFQVGAFRSAWMGLTGTAAGPVSFEAIAADNPACPGPCSFRPEYFELPAPGPPPRNVPVKFAGPDPYNVTLLLVRAKAPDVTAAGAVYCLDQVFGRSDASPFCQPVVPELPMNRLAFAFSTANGATPTTASQRSDLLSFGGQGYPFTATSSVPWADVSPASGTGPAPLTVTVDPSKLTAGPNTGLITVKAEGVQQDIVVSATLSNGPVITSIRNSANPSAPAAPNSFVTIYGAGFAAAPTVWSPTSDLPVSLAGAKVRIGGKDAYISYADPGQLNVLLPLGVPSGAASVEVTTPAGTASGATTVEAVSPGWFSYTVGSSTWVAALFANTATYVAPAGSLGALPSRSARTGDFLQLYANALGPTNPTAPGGVLLTTAYPIGDLSRVVVTIGGVVAPVQFAGLVSAGLYQVNIQVPPGIPAGDQTVLMMVDGRAAQNSATLNIQSQ